MEDRVVWIGVGLDSSEGGSFISWELWVCMGEHSLLASTVGQDVRVAQERLLMRCQGRRSSRERNGPVNISTGSGVSSLVLLERVMTRNPGYIDLGSVYTCLENMECCFGNVSSLLFLQAVCESVIMVTASWVIAIVWAIAAS